MKREKLLTLPKLYREPNKIRAYISPSHMNMHIQYKLLFNVRLGLFKLENFFYFN